MSPSLSRRERERQLRRDAILEAARTEFAEKGYARAKLEDIAKRAEFGKGTLYNYFEGGKQGMLFALFDRLFDEMESLVDRSLSAERIAANSFRDAFYDYTLSCLSFYLDRKELFLILVQEAHRMCFAEDQTHAAYFRRQQDRLVTALTQPIRRAIESGAIRPLDPQAIAHMILGNIQGLQVHMLLEADDLACHSPVRSPAEAAQFLTSLLLDGIAHPDEIPTPAKPQASSSPKNVSHAEHDRP